MFIEQTSIELRGQGHAMSNKRSLPSDVITAFSIAVDISETPGCISDLDHMYFPESLLDI